MRIIQKKWTLILILCLSAILQLLIASAPNRNGDVLENRIWTRALVDRGIVDAYDDPSLTSLGAVVDYPPVFPYVLLGAGRIVRFGAPQLFQSDVVGDFLVKLPPIIANLMIALTLFLSLSKSKPAVGLLAAALYAFNPAVLFDTCYWGQPDSICALLILLSALLAVRRPGWSFLCVILAVLTKPLAYPFLPLIAFAIVKQHGLRALLFSAIAGAILAGLVFSPFILAGSLPMIFSKLFTQLDMMPFVSVNAHNLWWSLGRGIPWAPADESLIPGISYRILGLAFFGSYGLLVLVKYGRSQTTEALFRAAASLAFGFFMLSTHMHENHLFYFLPLLSLFCFEIKSLKLVYLSISLTLLLNMALHDPFLIYALKPYRLGPEVSIPPQVDTLPPFLQTFAENGQIQYLELTKGGASLARLLLTLMNSQLNVLLFLYWTFTLLRCPNLDEPFSEAYHSPKRMFALIALLFLAATAGLFLSRIMRLQP